MQLFKDRIGSRRPLAGLAAGDVGGDAGVDALHDFTLLNELRRMVLSVAGLR